MLDVKAVVWLEQYLKRWPKTLLVVSHDREFLNEVTTDIIHLNAKVLTHYKYISFQNILSFQLSEIFENCLF
jgi:ATPase subunit of ABC transporter with duplicated ATPase domains